MQNSIEECVKNAKKGSEKDIEAIMRSFKNTIDMFANKYKCPTLDFEDAVQEGNIGLFKAILSYKENAGASFSTYAKKCIQNNILTALKASQSQKHQVLSNAQCLEEDSISFQSPEQDIIIKEQNIEFINLAKEKLSKFEFLVFSLYTMQYSYGEIAAITNKSEKSINNAVQRIRNKLRQ